MRRLKNILKHEIKDIVEENGQLYVILDDHYKFSVDSIFLNPITKKYFIPRGTCPIDLYTYKIETSINDDILKIIKDIKNGEINERDGYLKFLNVMPLFYQKSGDRLEWV